MTPLSPTTPSLNGFLTFGLDRGSELTLAAVLPAELSDSFLLFVSRSDISTKDVGIALVNPQDSSTTLTLSINNDSGEAIGAEVEIVVPPYGHLARFVGQELFANQPSIQSDFLGTLAVKSTAPVALLSLRFRGANFSPVPAVPLGPTSDVPVKTINTGGPGSLIFPHLAFGGGWTSELVIT